MIDNIVAKRYARALIQAADAKKDYEKIDAQFSDFVDMLAENTQLNDILLSPAVSPVKKKKILSDLAEKAKLHKVLSRLLELLTDKGRLSIIESVYQAYVDLINEKNGIIPAKFYYADNITDKDRKDIEKELKRITGKDLEFEMIKDDSLIGGVMIKIGGKIYDGSIKNKFSILRKQLTGE